MANQQKESLKQQNLQQNLLKKQKQIKTFKQSTNQQFKHSKIQNI